MAVAFAAVLAVQCAALLIIRRFTSEKLIDILVALFVAANAYHFALLTLEASTPTRFFFAALAGWRCMASAERRRAHRHAAPVRTVVFTSLSLGQYAYGRASLADETLGTAFTPLSIPVKSDRNVYLISMESLHSPSAMRELYGIDAPPHVAYLKSEGFRVLDRTYSVDTTTRRSYKRLARVLEALGKVLGAQQRLQDREFDAREFQGRRLSHPIHLRQQLHELEPGAPRPSVPESRFLRLRQRSEQLLLFHLPPPRSRALISKYLFGVGAPDNRARADRALERAHRNHQCR